MAHNIHAHVLLCNERIVANLLSYIPTKYY